MEKSNERIAIRVSRNTIIGNVLLAGFKMFAGIFANSAAMVSDAVHSLSDVFSSFIVIIGVKTAGKRSDKDHQYGHERFECVAAIILAAVLFATGAGIGWSGVKAVMANASDSTEIAAPGLLALVAAIVSIAVKEGMYWYARISAKKINSSVLMADAWHHRTDALSSVGSLIGIFGARMGVPILDPIACIVICFFILKAAITIFLDAVGKMTDKACDAQTEEKIRDTVLMQKSVVGIDMLKTRLFGDRIYVDVEISVDKSHTLHEAHDTAHQVHDSIESAFPNVKHCSVHVNPAE